MEKRKMGIGLRILLIVQFVSLIFTLYSAVNYLMNFEEMQQLLIQSQADLAAMDMDYFDIRIPTRIEYILSIGISFAQLVGVVLLFMKKQVGIFIFFGAAILSIGMSFITSGFSMIVLFSVLFSLIWFGIIAYQVNKNKHVYGLSEELSMQ